MAMRAIRASHATRIEPPRRGFVPPEQSADITCAPSTAATALQPRGCPDDYGAGISAFACVPMHSVEDAMFDLIIHGGQVVTPQGVGQWDVAVVGEKIVS